MCPLPIFVIVAISGFAIFANFSMSPKLFVPISSIKTSVDSSIFKIVIGKPKLLLKFPSVQWVLYLVLTIEFANSFVEVFPFVPVIPITTIFFSKERIYFAKSSKNFSLFFILISLLPLVTSPIHIEAPFCMHSFIYSFPL